MTVSDGALRLTPLRCAFRARSRAWERTGARP